MHVPIPDRGVLMARAEAEPYVVRLDGPFDAGVAWNVRGAIATPRLPTRKVLQSTFPSKRKVQPPVRRASLPTGPSAHSSASPLS